MSEPTQVHIEDDFLRQQLRIHLSHRPGDGTIRVRQFGEQSISIVGIAEAAAPVDESPLLLNLDEARALYEALADHFGHSGNDTRALRRDYDAERGRVDKLINHLIEVDR